MIGIIGATSYLGQHLVNQLDGYALSGRFEWSQDEWKKLANGHPHIKNIVILSRACRKEEPRRDIDTMTTEVRGLSNIVSAFSNRRIIYTSTKAIWKKEQYSPGRVSREDIGLMIDVASRGHLRNKIINIPTNKNGGRVYADEFNGEKPIDIYGATKICGELLIRNCCKDYTIFRIWDIA
jgi:nucleoside-diphosphate-sugar epimerase